MAYDQAAKDHTDRLEKMKAMRRDGLHFEIFYHLRLPSAAYETYCKRVSKDDVSWSVAETCLNIGAQQLFEDDGMTYFDQDDKFCDNLNVEKLIKLAEHNLPAGKKDMADAWIKSDAKTCPTETWQLIFDPAMSDDQFDSLLMLRLAADCVKEHVETADWFHSFARCFTEDV